jgi:hypothetical protein
MSIIIPDAPTLKNSGGFRCGSGSPFDSWLILITSVVALLVGLALLVGNRKGITSPKKAKKSRKKGGQPMTARKLLQGVGNKAPWVLVMKVTEWSPAQT